MMNNNNKKFGRGSYREDTQNREENKIKNLNREMMYSTNNIMMLLNLGIEPAKNSGISEV